jgi:hypothetical protein
MRYAGLVISNAVEEIPPAALLGEPYATYSFEGGAQGWTTTGIPTWSRQNAGDPGWSRVTLGFDSRGGPVRVRFRFTSGLIISPLVSRRSPAFASTKSRWESRRRSDRGEQGCVRPWPSARARPHGDRPALIRRGRLKRFPNCGSVLSQKTVPCGKGDTAAALLIPALGAVSIGVKPFRVERAGGRRPASMSARFTRTAASQMTTSFSSRAPVRRFRP